MRINQFVALASGLSRRAADKAIDQQRVTINGATAKLGEQITTRDQIQLDGKDLKPLQQTTTIMLNKPVGYVCSRDGQGSKTIYDLLPPKLHELKPVGRLDKDSSGLILLTNDGQLAQQLTHPSFQKEKVYEVSLDKSLTPSDFSKIQSGIALSDGKSRLGLQKLKTRNEQLANTQKLIPNSYFLVTMKEGRNRQIRRTFEALDYRIETLHRTGFGPYRLGELTSGKFKKLLYNNTSEHI